MSDVTVILNAIEGGSARSEDLLPLVYNELRRLATAQMAQEQPGRTLQATALVHEAYLRLLGDRNTPTWENRRHFFGAAAEAMRRILIEQARRRNRVRHGGEFQRVDADDPDAFPAEVDSPHQDLELLDAALSAFEAEEPQKAELVKLRYFAGLTEDEAARTLGISRPTASRWWTYARTWLFENMQSGESEEL